MTATGSTGQTDVTFGGSPQAIRHHYDIGNEFYRLWLDALVPLVGKLLPGGGAYTYLPASVRRFPGPHELEELLRAAGFGDVRHRLFAGGIVALHTGEAS